MIKCLILIDTREISDESLQCTLGTSDKTYHQTGTFIRTNNFNTDIPE